MAYVDIALCLDDRYAPGALATIHSALVHLRESSTLRVHLIADYLSQDVRHDILERVSRVAEIHEYYSAGPLKVTKLRKWFHSATLGRLWLDILPDELARLIYLDCDTIVREDLTRLASVNLNGHILGAVCNLVAPDRRIQIADDSVARLDYGSENPGHFDAGVLVLDLPGWKAEEYGPRARELWQKHGDGFEAPDQDVLNYLFAGSWQPLSPIWNKSVEVAIGQMTSDDWLTGEHGILHYSGRIKPWSEDFPDGPKKELFRAHLLL